MPEKKSPSRFGWGSFTLSAVLLEASDALFDGWVGAEESPHPLHRRAAERVDDTHVGRARLHLLTGLDRNPSLKFKEGVLETHWRTNKLCCRLIGFKLARSADRELNHHRRDWSDH